MSSRASSMKALDTAGSIDVTSPSKHHSSEAGRPPTEQARAAIMMREGLSACASPGLGRRRGGQVAACNRVDGYGGQHAPRVSTVRDLGANPPLLGELLAHPRRLAPGAGRHPVADTQVESLLWVEGDPRVEVPLAVENPSQRETRGHEQPPRARPVSAHQHGPDASEMCCGVRILS